MAKQPINAPDGYAEALRRIEQCRRDGRKLLDLSDLKLTAVPPELGNLAALTTLSLDDNQLTAVPPELSNLTALKMLFLQKNQLTVVPPELGNLAALNELYIHDNRLTAVPPELGNLAALTTLSVSHNRLTAVPPELGNLAALTTLYLNVNRLTAVPTELGNLTALKKLYIHDNQLTAVPPELGNLAALTELYLDDNHLVSLPSKLLELTVLERLYLHGNPDLGLPDSILGPTNREVNNGAKSARAADILAYYFRTGEQPLNEIKMMLVGEGGAGKSSLRKFFTGKRHDKNERETTGITLGSFRLDCGGADITVRLWDFAGQAITHSLHQFFLTEGCVYLVVLEPRSDNEEADAAKWLRLIQRYGNGAPTLVVLNKQDTRPPHGYDIDRNKLKERFPFIRGFARTTCGSDRSSCEALRETVRELIATIPAATERVPASWVAVKTACFRKQPKVAREVPAKRPPYLTLEEFCKLCAKHGERERPKQEQLARILHKLGAVLHFIDEPRLRDAAVLDPHWVTDGAYRLLRAKDGGDGVLTLPEAVAKVPGDGDARYLLRLMERFEMCFPLDNDDPDVPPDRWLVPGALVKNQPDAIKIGEWQSPGRVRLRYTHDPLLEGVLPRFIVLTHVLSEKQPRWRYGVVLEHGGAKALVRRGGTENTVEVIVQGEPADRDALVRIVRGFFERVHRDLPGPPPVEAQELEGRFDVFETVAVLRRTEKADVPLVVEEPTGVLVKLDATTELNRTTAEEPRTTARRPLHVFVSYAHKDNRARLEFRPNLECLKSDGYITYWDDEGIDAGDQWLEVIRGEVQKMDVFVGLVTTPFRASKFILSEEWGVALKRYEAGEVKLFLIMVEDFPIAGTPFARFQLHRPGGKDVKHFGLRKGFNMVEKELRDLIKNRWRALPEDHGRSRAAGL